MIGLAAVALCFQLYSLLLANIKGDEQIQDRPVSNKPFNLTVGKVTNTTIDLSWNKPENPSGEIQGYLIYYVYENSPATKSVNSTLSRVHYTLKQLKPFTTYNIWVESFVMGGEGDSDGEKSETLLQSTDVSGPGPPRIINVTCISPNSLFIQWQRPIEFYNKIDAYYVSYRREDENEFENITIDTLKEDVESKIITNLTDNTIHEVYLSAASRSVLNLNHYMQGVPSESKKVLIKSDCDLSNDALEGTNKILNVVFITGLICASFALFLVICAITIWRHCVHGAYYYLEESRQVVAAPAFDWTAKNEEHPPVPVNLFAKHVAALHADGDIGFSKEYDIIQSISYLQHHMSSDVSTHPENKLKNRYLNIVAYDHSRVRLLGGHGQNRWVDYINANYIDGFEKTNAYIGTQGPLPNTFDCFWRMVWEQGVSVIVMITNLVERGRRKCDMYWPKEGTETYGQIQVKLVKEEILAMYTVRTMKISHLKTKRKKFAIVERVVQQFHYTNWHDHGTPDHPLPILSFVNKSSSANHPNSGPIVVHCSAGVGRTGTYIVLDAMLKQIRARNEVNIFGYLKYIRNQRNFLVQTEEQYIFIHDAILEAITFAENALSTECLHFILQPNAETDSEHWKQFEANYKMVTSFEAKDYNHISANKPCNLPKNRSQEFIPIESYRVHLTPKPGIEGSDYINASWILGFKKLKEFIITQHPLEQTILEFWQMIWDHNAQTIVLLSAVDGSDGYRAFWPAEKDSTLDSDNFKLKIIEESELDGTVSRDFSIQSLHDDYELTVRVIQPSHTITEISDIVQLINLVQQFHLEYQNGPIVVVDELGGTVAATFCCLTTLMKQMEYDSHADVSIYAKLYHNRIPGIWKTIDDYLMLYRGLSVITSNKGVSLIASPDPYIHTNSTYTNGTAL